MTGFRTIPIDPTICEQVRTTHKSPQYGHPAYVETAAGYGPCRACLKQFRVGTQDRILFTYDPFAGIDSYPSPGPVFIHANSCTAFSERGTFPDELRELPLTLEPRGLRMSPARPPGGVRTLLEMGGVGWALLLVAA